MTAMLEMRNVSKSFSGRAGAARRQLLGRGGQIHALVGENGAGKSTLMKVLSGVYPAGSYEGTIVFEGEERRFRDINDSEALGIIIIHQELALIPLMSIAENIFLGIGRPNSASSTRDEVYRRTRELLAQVGLKESPGYADHRSRRRQAAAGRDRQGAVQAGADADPGRADREPQRGRQRRAAGTLLMEFREQGIGSILISHKLNEVAKVADHITVLRDGRTVDSIDCRAELIRKTASSAAWSTAISPIAFRERSAKIGEPLSRGRELVGLSSHPSRAAGDQERQFRRQARRGRRHCRADGRRAHRIRHEPVRPRPGHQYQRPHPARGPSRSRCTSVAAAIDAGLAYVTEDRKQLGLILADDVRKNITLASLDRSRRPGDRRHRAS